MANEGGKSTVLLREYRKGNWTVEETMVLIGAKKMDEERRTKRMIGGEGEGGTSRTKPAELRWKWVEDYCWKNGCLRSQNQCNDKWDNLMRDFKKVRDHEMIISRRSMADQNSNTTELGSSSSYWKIDKSERKERSLPSNMLPQIYEALVEVVDRRGGLRMLTGGGGGSGSANSNVHGGGGGAHLLERSTSNVVHDHRQPSLPPPSALQHPISAPPHLEALPPPPQPQPPPAAQPQSLPHSQPLPTPDSDTSEYSDSPAKRRRRGGGGGEGNTSGSNTSNKEVGSAICRSASVIAEGIQACEDRAERRHRQVLDLQERRLEIEESKTEITRQAINGLVDSINKLANSILALASQSNPTPPK